MRRNWHYGNATKDTVGTRGWILGHFIKSDEDVRHTKDIEVKWGVHSAGERRSGWTIGDQRTTLVLLVRGTFQIDITENSKVLSEQGDYVVWGPGIDHSWEALSDSVVLTVRWPSTS